MNHTRPKVGDRTPEQTPAQGVRLNLTFAEPRWLTIFFILDTGRLSPMLYLPSYAHPSCCRQARRGAKAAKREQIRLLIADDHALILEGLVATIGREEDMAVVAKGCQWTRGC